MAVEKMRMMSLIALKKDAHEIFERIVLNGSVHLGSDSKSSNFTMDYLQNNKEPLLKMGVDITRIQPFESERKFERKKYKDLLDRLFMFIGIQEDELLKNYDAKKMDISEHLKTLSPLDEQATNIRDYEMANEFAIKNTQTLIRVLEFFEDSKVDISDITGMKNINAYAGEVSKNSWKKIKDNSDNIKNIAIHMGSTPRGEAIIMFAPKLYEEETQRFLKSVSFEKVDLPETPMETSDFLQIKKDELMNLEHQKGRVQKAKEVFKEMYENEVIALYFRYRIMEKIEYLEFHTAQSGKFMILNAFVPESESQNLKESVENNVQDAVIEFESDKVVPKKMTIPTKLKNNFIVAPFEILVKMYSVPSYHEIDPTGFFAVTYMLLFGMMFGDIGQGIVIILAGTLLKDKIGQLGGVLQRIGISSTIFGFIYGSVFGLENLVPALVIRPMEQINTILIFAIVFGVVLITISYIMGFVNLKNMGKYADLYFDKNGLSGFAFYAAFLLFVVNMAVGEKYFSDNTSLITMCTAIVMVATTCLMVFKLKLKPKVEKKREQETEEKFSAVESGFEMFETIMSFFSNTLSFIRVGAFAINHVGLFMAFYALGQMIGTSAGNIVMIIIGNIVLLTLEVLIVFIQAIRLEYYELFSKYFVGNGLLYTPLKFDKDHD